MDQVLKILGRILLTVPIAVFGLFHLMRGAGMAGIVPDWIPFPVFWIYFTGVFHIVYAVVAIGNLPFSRWVALFAAGLLLFYALGIHLPNVLAGGEGAMNSLMSLLKDTGLAGGALYLSTDLKK